MTPDIPDMAAVAKSLQHAGTVPDVVISLGALQTVTSAFVAGLLVMRRLIRAAGGNFVLCDLQPHVRAVLQRLNLHTLLGVRN
jgi:anti-anti-sigma regulatory factor